MGTIIQKKNIFLKMFFLVLLSLFSISFCRVVLESVEQDHAESNGWIQTDSIVDLKQKIQLSFAVKLQNMDKLNAALMDVSDPISENYGKHWKKEKIDSVFGPSKKSIQIVKNFIKNHFGNSIEIDSSSVGYLNVEAPLEIVSKTFECQFKELKHQEANFTIIRTKSYSVDESISKHIDFIAGLIRVPNVDQNRLEKRQNVPWLGVTPRMIRKRYNVSDVEPKSPKNRQAIAQFLGQHYSDVDLQEFFLLQYQSLIGTTPSKTIGPNGLVPGVESDLDVQYILSVSSGVDTWVFSDEPALHNGQEPFLNWIQSVSKLSDDEVPKTISVSYGDVEATISKSYAYRVNAEFERMGLRGVSIFFAAGDSGAACSVAGNTFQPDFPASCPSVTTVGGTETTGAFETGPEVVNFIGGSGFSNYFAQPQYQKTAVESYLKNAKKLGTLPPASFYNVTGRAYPDIAAFSSNFWVIYSLLPMPVSGTSCAAPSATAIFSLVNDYRLQHGKPTLGFLNPLIYSMNGKGFHDVVKDCNNGCYKGRGFCATPGFDLASGWGSPNYQALI